MSRGIIWKNDKDYHGIVAPLLERKEIQDLRLYRQHNRTDRLTHSICVSYLGYSWAKRLDCDYVSTARGGLMHDMYYYQTGEVSFSKGNHLNNHPKIALINAKNITELNEIEEDIILKHMFGYTMERPKYKESYLISLADKVCATREFMLPNLYYGVEVLEIMADKHLKQAASVINLVQPK